MAIHRLKHSFTAGELHPLMDARVDFARYNNGCKILLNMQSTVQGPVTRRNGFKFIYDLTSLGLDIADPRVRIIPFVFNELQAYTLIFFMHTDGDTRMVIATQEGLVVHPDPVDTYCPPDPYTVAYTGLAAYNIPIDIAAAGDVVVKHTASDGTETDLTLTTHYTVVINTDPTADVITVTSGPSSSDGTLDFYLVNQASPGDVVTLVLPATWDIDIFDWAQSADEMYIAQSGLTPYAIKRYGHACWSLNELGFTDAPSVWSSDNGWPERLSFHQQRLAYGASTVSRQTVWMSKAGDFLDFGVSAPLVDADSVSFTLDSGTQNKIAWMASRKALNVGTIGNEWTVSGNNQAALTPSNIWSQPQTKIGGAFLKPLVVANATIFIDRHNRTVYEFVYDYNQDSFTTSDVTILAPHLTELYNITDWSYKDTPDKTVYATRSDGIILGLTYQRQHEVVAWHRLVTDGKFKKLTTIPGDREDELWTIVNRTIDGVEKYYLEKMAPNAYTEVASDYKFFDSYLEYSGTATSTITGLDHLEAKTVKVTAGGAVHPDRVVTSGEIELNAEYTDVTIGLGFTSEVWPNLAEVPQDDGAGFGRMQRLVKVYLSLYRSLGCIIGRVDEEGNEVTEEIPFRVPANLTGQSPPLFTGIKNIDFLEGADRDYKYFIRQTSQLPLTVRSVTDIVEITK